MQATDRAAIQLYAPDLAHLPHFYDVPPGAPHRPDWFQRIVWDCQAAALRHACAVAGWPDYDDPEYDATYIESYAEWFPKLLAEALATREAQPWD